MSEQTTTVTKGMYINFNNVRKQALFAYHRLAVKLNEFTEDGTVTVEAEDIREDMDDLRTLLFSIACCFEDGSEEFKDVSAECDPIAYFNYDEDEEG